MGTEDMLKLRACMLIMLGLEDLHAPQSQGRELSYALKALGQDTR